MTGTTRSSAGLDERRRRLLYRSWHRGTREMDLIMGRFADAVISELSEAEVDALEALSEFPDPDLYAWLTYEAFRAQHSRRPRFEGWLQLHGHMGGEYANPGDFRRKAKAALRKIQAVYPGLKLGKRQGGIEILAASQSAIQPREIPIGRD